MKTTTAAKDRLEIAYAAELDEGKIQLLMDRSGGFHLADADRFGERIPGTGRPLSATEALRTFLEACEDPVSATIGPAFGQFRKRLLAGLATMPPLNMTPPDAQN